MDPVRQKKYGVISLNRKVKARNSSMGNTVEIMTLYYSFAQFC